MLDIRNISIILGEKCVLNDVNLSINQGEIYCLLGPSGCGKTTLLRIIAGLEARFAGSVCLNGVDISHKPLHKRDFGLIFQEHALFPHMTVQDNVGFGLRMQRMSGREIQYRVAEMLTLVDMIGYGNRRVAELSGGERQRVALARSLAPAPRILMLDEPVGSLDARLKDRLVQDLREILKTTGVTAIYVTHDHQEAFAIADRLGVMNEGYIEQEGEPEAVYINPTSVFVAKFLGLQNIYDAQVLSTVDSLRAVWQSSIGSSEVLIHPAGITLAERRGERTVQARIADMKFAGGNYELVVQVIGTDIKLAFSTQYQFDNSLSTGDDVYVMIDSRYVLPLPQIVDA